MLRLLSPLQKEDDAMLDGEGRSRDSPTGSSKQTASPLDMNIYATRKTVAQGMMVRMMR